MKIEANVRNLSKTVGASTHTFKNCGCYSTHSTHTYEGPALEIKVVYNMSLPIQVVAINSNWLSVYLLHLSKALICGRQHIRNQCLQVYIVQCPCEIRILLHEIAFGCKWKLMTVYHTWSNIMYSMEFDMLVKRNIFKNLQLCTQGPFKLEI